MKKSYYIASRSKHWRRWKKFREEGIHIISSWIDVMEKTESEGLTAEEWSGLAQMCIKEAARADVLVFYAEEEELHRGALLEVGAALIAGKEVRAVVEGDYYEGTIFFPHPQVKRCDSLYEAFEVQVNIYAVGLIEKGPPGEVVIINTPEELKRYLGAEDEES